MSLFSGYGVSLSTVKLLGQASMTSYGDPPPAGWSVYKTFDNQWTGASATVLKNGNSYIVAFRGTDEANDTSQYPLLYTGLYIRAFDTLLKSLPVGAKYYVTGASLGGGAANNLADIADTAYGGKFADATFVAFASPNISNAEGVLNIGFENDPVYKLIEGYGDEPSSLDNLVLATREYMAGNYNGRVPFNDYAHGDDGALAVFDRLSSSIYQKRMEPDSVVIFDAHDGKVQDITPGRSTTGAFYLGEDRADAIVGRSGNDFIEGFRGDDVLRGGSGADHLRGGLGNDLLVGGRGRDAFVFDSRPNDATNVDTIRDFDVALDTIQLNNGRGFSQVGPNGTLSSRAFCKGAQAQDSSDRVIYDDATGAVYYDADGTGAAAQVRFAQLAPGLALTAADILVI